MADIVTLFFPKMEDIVLIVMLLLKTNIIFICMSSLHLAQREASEARPEKHDFKVTRIYKKICEKW